MRQRANLRNKTAKIVTSANVPSVWKFVRLRRMNINHNHWMPELFLTGPTKNRGCLLDWLTTHYYTPVTRLPTGARGNCPALRCMVRIWEGAIKSPHLNPQQPKPLPLRVSNKCKILVGTQIHSNMSPLLRLNGCVNLTPLTKHRFSRTCWLVTPLQ